MNASRLKRRADDLLVGLHLRPGVDASMPERAQSALSVLQAADETSAPPGSTLRLSGQFRSPFGERPRTTGHLIDQSKPRSLAPIETRKGRSAGGTGQASSPTLDDESISGSLADYEKEFGITPWSEQGSSLDSSAQGSEKGSPPKVAGSSKRRVRKGASSPLGFDDESNNNRRSLSPRPVRLALLNRRTDCLTG